MRFPGAAVLPVLLLLSACGGGGRKGGDEDAGPDATLPEPAPPEPPAPPSLAPCPKGWGEAVDADAPEVVTCDPWPGGAEPRCGPHEIRLPGEPACRLVGTPCPAGDFAEDLPADGAVVYVRAGAGAGGDGSRGRPFGRISDAIAAAPPGAVVAISKGTFDEVVTVSRALTLWGACVAETVVSSSRPSEMNATLTLRANGASARNLRVSGERPGLDAALGSVEVDSVVVDGAVMSGVAAYAAGTLVARDLLVRGTRQSAGSLGSALQVSEGARVSVAGAVFEGNAFIGVIVLGAGSSVDAADLVVRDTAPGARDRLYGWGVDVTETATVSLARTVVEGNAGIAIRVMDEASELQATDVVVRDTRIEEGSGGGGNGILVLGGGYARFARALFERNTSLAIGVDEAGTVLEMEDGVVGPTEARMDDSTSGYGLQLTAGAQASLTRVALRRSTTLGINVAGDGTELVATDLAVRDTRVGGGVGFAVQVVDGARLDVERVACERSAGAAVYAEAEGTVIAGTDLAVRGTEIGGGPRPAGLGIQVRGRARAEIVRLSVEDNHHGGVVVVESGSAAFEDLLVARTEARDDGLGGSGLISTNNGSLRAESFRVSDSALCGLLIAMGGEMDLASGVVSRNQIGANVQTEGFDVGRISRQVLYLDNERNLDSSALPVPEPVDRIAP